MPEKTKYEIVPPHKLVAPILFTYPTGKVRVYTLHDLFAQRADIVARMATDIDDETAATLKADLVTLDDHIVRVRKLVAHLPGPDTPPE